ncbi:hypothetical protein B9Z55_015230 [Caenorhabditis nigoni]|uniref:Uncharacterized protein n=1 Tax=Caenorhabditis nigoni TaxID=1611254 RepID=A0A2G5U9C9_9PELO|nr:hypothetical protein B9Z55_015230 [Caenorhabditis nigoni]
MPDYVIVADIAKASIKPSKPVTAQNIQIYRFTVSPFGSPASPFLLAAYIYYCLDSNPGRSQSRDQRQYLCR